VSDNSKDKDFAPINVEISDRIPMASQRQSNGKPTTVVTKSSNVLGILCLVLVIVAGAACGYLFHLHQTSLDAIEQAKTRIETLENRLNATGEEMGNSTVALQVKVTELSTRTQELWEQMDKLWASAWRRNQSEIKSIEADLVGLQKNTTNAAKSLETKIADASSSVQKLQNRIDGVNTKVSSQSNDLLAINVNSDELQNEVNKQNTELRQMAEKLILLEKRNTNLLQQLQQLEAKLNELANKSV
jgi:chromosome segregation ATPase